jgi:phenylpropionate dioxygenase-like ring-hydroxylating dioxygenase large terminal subunit
VLFRDAGGVCRALADRCAHRRAPLSRGRVTQQCFIECPYHGWRYDGATGACIAIPNLRPDEKIPKNYRVSVYETWERDGFIQILLGQGDARAEAGSVEVPNLGRQWQGERFLAYPEELFIDTLVDCPSSILSITGVQILDDPG